MFKANQYFLTNKLDLIELIQHNNNNNYKSSYNNNIMLTSIIGSTIEE
jgi:hypothetical protein